MASAPDVPNPPGHPSSPVGLTMNSGSHGSPRDRSQSRENSPGPDPLIVLQGDDLDEHLKERRLLGANRSVTPDDGVSNPFPYFGTNKPFSASNEDEGEDMTEEEFFAQLGEEVPEWAKQPLDAAPQVQGDGGGDDVDLMELDDEEIQAQLDAENEAEDDLVELNDEEIQAQLDAEIEAEDDPTELSEAALTRQLNAELWAEERRKKEAEDAQRKARLQEAMLTAPNTQADPFDQEGDFTIPTEEELEAELAADLDARLEDDFAGGDAAEDPTGTIDDTLAVMSKLQPSINPVTVKSYPKTQRKARANEKAKTVAPKPKKPAPGKSKTNVPLGARVGRNKPPPMRRTDELPQMYHHHNPINWSIIRKHMNLSTRVDLNHCYQALGLDVGRGKAVYEELKAHLRTPGNSVDLSAKNVGTEAVKRIIARIAHRLLIKEGWGQKHFNRPSLASGCKYIPFDNNSTEVFLEFTSLVYKAMKLEEKRKKGKAKHQEEKDASAVVQHPTSQTVDTTTYHSPRAVAQPPTSEPEVIITHCSPRAVAQPQPLPPQATTPHPVAAQPPRPQAYVNTPNSPVQCVAQPLPPPPPQAHPAPCPVSAQSLRHQACINAANNAVQNAKQPPRSQAFINGAIVAPRSVAPPPLSGGMSPLQEAIMRMQAGGK